MFVMHRKSGIISTRQALDRETAPSYQLQVHAVDGGGRSCTMDVYITLTDVNDNQPVFSHLLYEVSTWTSLPHLSIKTLTLS